MKDHNIMILDKNGDEIGTLKVGVLNDGSIGIVDMNYFSYNIDHDCNDDDTSVIFRRF